MHTDEFWVGVTDNHWYKFLAERNLDEVNFWQPSATPPFTNRPVGMPFLFKLKRPYNHIAGGGFFVTYNKIPLSLAWDIFGEKNGASSHAEFRQLIGELSADKSEDVEIGCTVLANVFYLDQGDWLPDPPEWSGPIVRGKSYKFASSAGAFIWEHVQQRSSSAPILELDSEPSHQLRADLRAKYGEPILVKPRLGQSSFRLLVTEAYHRRCAITGENTLEVLEAAHIVPFSSEGSHEVNNGLLLRADFHRLYDVGLVSVTPEYRVKVSPVIREKWLNGRVYYRLDNQPLSITPDKSENQPDRDKLDWHYKNVFRAG